MEALKYFAGSRYELYACVVMHDHVHLLIKPLIKSRVQDLVHSWKSFTAHKLRRDYGRKTPIWQEEYFDRIIRDEKEFLDKAQYIINNPLKRWPDEEEYPWVWIKEQILHRAGVSPADNDESGCGGHGGPPYRVTVTTKENAHIG